MDLTSKLRRMHNDIKLELLRDACSRASATTGANILDLGCGVGGDIVKYLRINASYVLGVDTSKESIVEARARLAGVEVPPNTQIMFLATKNTAKELPFMLFANSINVVTCQFALHFLVDEPGFPDLLKSIVRAMRPGAVFVCSILDGDRVDLAMGSSSSYESPLLSMERRGSRIEFLLKEKTRYFGSGSSFELLLYPEDLIQLFIDSGLRFLYWNNFEKYYSKAPAYPDALKDISKLYCAFAFQKK